MPRFLPFTPATSVELAPIERVTTGALVFTSIAEMTERGRPTNEGIDALNRDVRNTLVYADPEEARAAAKTAREKADGLSSTLPSAAATLREIATHLDQDASICEVRQKGLDPARVKREISYSKSFFTFKANWDEFYRSVRNGDIFSEFSGNDVAAMIDSYDAQYRTFVQGYQDLGFKLATPAPPKSNAGDTLPNVNANVKGFFDAIPWGTIAVVGAVGVGGYIAYRVLSSPKEEHVTVVTAPSNA